MWAASGALSSALQPGEQEAPASLPAGTTARSAGAVKTWQTHCFWAMKSISAGNLHAEIESSLPGIITFGNLFFHSHLVVIYVLWRAGYSCGTSLGLEGLVVIRKDESSQDCQLPIWCCALTFEVCYVTLELALVTYLDAQYKSWAGVQGQGSTT